MGDVLYESLNDRLYGAPGTWNFRLCSNPDCGLTWLDPVPVEKEIRKAYAEYYTHGREPKNVPRLATRLGNAVSTILSIADPLRHERNKLSLMYLDDRRPGRLLDVGCGNGVRLSRLRDLGWDACGQDVDPAAVSYACQNLGLEVHLGRLEDLRFPPMSFDCITLNHVIEHAHDPAGLLGECRRLLKLDGLIVVVTPNVKSFAHQHFGSSWRGLEPPRHIHLFSPKTLASVAAKAGLTVQGLWTSVANAKTFAHGSLLTKSNGDRSSRVASAFLRRAHTIWFFYRSMLAHAQDSNSGEECVACLVP